MKNDKNRTLPDGQTGKKLPQWSVFLLGAATAVLVVLAVAVGWFVEDVLLDRGRSASEPEQALERWADHAEAEIEQWADGVEHQAESLLNQTKQDVKGNDGLRSTVSYADAGRYQKGACTVSDPVQRLEINWISGTVRLEHWDGTDILLEENAGDSADHQLRWRLENGILTVQYCAAGRYKNLPEKDLVVKLPQNGSITVSVDTVSADCAAIDLHLKELEFESTSGSLQADGTYGSLSGETVSGGLIVKGEIGELEVDTTSGNTELTLQITPDELSFEGVSGDLKLYLSGERSFSLEQETVSGTIDCEFPLQGNGEHRSYNSGTAAPAAELELSTVSGRMELLKLQ